MKPTTNSISRKRRAPNSAPEGQKGLLERPTSTISESVYKRLYGQIISLELPPGTPISENAVATSEGVSRTPVREAVLRLSEEKLVEVVPKSGTFVARIPTSALPEALVARRGLEAMTVRSAARIATKSQLLSLYACLEKFNEAIAASDFHALHHVDEEFHHLIAQIGRLPGLWTLVQQVKVQIDRYRCLTLQFPEEGRADKVAQEHLAIVKAIESRDEIAAMAAMEAHLTELQHHFSIGIALYPDYFIHDIDLADFPDI